MTIQSHLTKLSPYKQSLVSRARFQEYPSRKYIRFSTILKHRFEEPPGWPEIPLKRNKSCQEREIPPNGSRSLDNDRSPSKLLASASVTAGITRKRCTLAAPPNTHYPTFGLSTFHFRPRFHSLQSPALSESHLKTSPMSSSV